MTVVAPGWISYVYLYSFTLLSLLAVAPDVIANDQLTWTELSQVLSAKQYDNIVISPGPGTPNCAADIGRFALASISEASWIQLRSQHR